MTGRPPKEPIYTTSTGVKVISEYPKGERIYCRIRRHPFFPGVEVARARIVMSSLLGRALDADEHVHHRNGVKSDDRPENLQVLRAEEHNRHHKQGTRHTAGSRQRIGQSLRRAYAEGRRPRPDLAISVTNLLKWNFKIREGKADWPRKLQRNMALLETHRATGSLKSTAAAFGISASSAYEIIRKYNPQQLKQRCIRKA